MDDLELVRACAEAMGFPDVHVAHTAGGKAYVKYGGRMITQGTEYRPLHDDTQAMALVKRFRLDILDLRGAWNVRYSDDEDAEKWYMGDHESLNRAICMAVAAMQRAKHGQ